MAPSTARTPSLSRGSLRRQSSTIRTGCANERPSGSARGVPREWYPYRDHQASDGFGFGDGFDLVFRRLLEEKQASDGCGAIFSYPCEFTSEGSSTGAISVVVPTNIGDFV